MKPINAILTPLKLLVNTNLFIALAALAMAEQSYLWAGKPFALTPLAIIIFLSTLFVYNWHRILSNRKRLQYAKPGMHQWINTNKWWPKLSIVVAAVGIGICFWWLSFQLQIILAILGLVCVAYALPITLWKGARVRLRDLGLFKPFLLGMVWSFATALLPLLDAGMHLSSTALWLIVIKRFLFISAICIPFDIKDMEFDWQTMQHPTLPIRVGERGARMVAVLVLLMFEALVLIQNGVTPVGIALTLSFFYTFAVVAYRNPTGSEYYYTIGIDSTMLVQFILVYAAVTFA